MRQTTRFIDISLPLRSGMITWPGDEEVRVERTLDMEKGDPYNLSRLCLSLHAGTHLDAPLHFLSGGMDISSMPLEATIGPCRVVGITGRPHIDREDVEPLSPREGERILFKTRNSTRAWWQEPFTEDYVHLSREGAAYLAERGVLLVGMDYLSVGPFGAGAEDVHQELLKAGVWVLEGLNLCEVEPGDYELLCLPLRVENGEGAPARAILRPFPR